MTLRPKITRSVILSAACLAASAGVAGCDVSGDRDDREDVKRVVTDSIRAAHAGNATEACSLYTGAYVRESLRENRELRLKRRTCTELVAALRVVFQQLTPNPRPKVTNPEVSGDKATARLQIETALGPAASRIFLVRHGDDWRIDHDEDYGPGFRDGGAAMPSRGTTDTSAALVASGASSSSPPRLEGGFDRMVGPGAPPYGPGAPAPRPA